MASQFIGVVSSAFTGKVYMVVNSDNDAKLDNPKLLDLAIDGDDGPFVMTKIPRATYNSMLSPNDVSEIVAKFQK